MKIAIFAILVGLMLLFGCLDQIGASEDNQSVGHGQVNASSSAMADCGTDMGCFIEKSETCAPSKILYSTSLNFFGANSTTISFLQINGSQGSKCVFYIKTMNSSVTYTPDLIQQLQSSGLTMEQIKKQEQDANAQIGSAGYYDDTCLFDTQDLAAMLTRWNEGKLSSNDYKNASCSGKIFSSSKTSNMTSNITISTTSPAKNETVMKENYTAQMWDALFRHDASLAKSMIEAGADITTPNPQSWVQTPLIYVCGGENNINDKDVEELVTLLIEKGADVNTNPTSKLSPLMNALKWEKEGCARILIERGADVNEENEYPNSEHKTPLMYAAEKGNYNITSLLIERGADLNAKDFTYNDYKTSLIWAAEKGSSDVVRLLIEKGADVNAQDRFGRTAVSYAYSNNHPDIETMLRTAGAR